MIKNFVYIDEYKMYSLSSQLFAGITESLVEDSINGTTSNEEQKGPFASGEKLVKAITNEARVTQRRSLNDYAYTLFEQELFDHDKVLVLDQSNIDSKIEKLDEFSFVKLTGKVVFHDVQRLRTMIESFNSFGESMTYVTTHAERTQAKSELEASPKTAAQKKALRDIDNIKELAMKSGLQQDDRFLKELSYLLGYGYSDLLEVQVRLDGKLFSCPLNRECLRDSIQSLTTKYARHTGREFSILGIVTQHSTEELQMDDGHKTSIKEAMFNMVNHLAAVESNYTGRLENEIVIEPIAIYSEL